MKASWYTSLEGITKTIHMRKANVYNREFATLLCSKGPFARCKRDPAIHVNIYIFIYIYTEMHVQIHMRTGLVFALGKLGPSITLRVARS